MQIFWCTLKDGASSRILLVYQGGSCIIDQSGVLPHCNNTISHDPVSLLIVYSKFITFTLEGIPISKSLSYFCCDEFWLTKAFLIFLIFNERMVIQNTVVQVVPTDVINFIEYIGHVKCRKLQSLLNSSLLEFLSSFFYHCLRGVESHNSGRQYI